MYMRIKETTVEGEHMITKFMCPECGYEMTEKIYYLRKNPPLKQCPLCARDAKEEAQGFFKCDDCGKRKKLSERLRITVYKREHSGREFPISREVICLSCYYDREPLVTPGEAPE